MKTPNERIVTLKLTRHEVCNLLLSTTASAQRSGATKWRPLHDKIKQILAQHDAKADGGDG